MSEITVVWAKLPLGQLVTLQNGFAFRSSDYVKKGHFVVRIGNVQDGKIALANPVYVDASDDKTEPFVLTAGDLLMSLTGNVGRVAFITALHLPAVLNQRVARICPNSLDGVNIKFLFFFLQTQSAKELLLGAAKGAAQLNISGKDVLALEFPLPPLAEQQEIAARLDDLLARVETLKTRLDAIPAILKRFRQATLAAACSGRLTEDWRTQHALTGNGHALLGGIHAAFHEQAGTVKARGQVKQAQCMATELLSMNALPETWCACTVGAIGLVSNGSTPSRRRDEYWNGDIPWVSSGEVRNNRIKETREAITQAGYDSASVRLLPPGTVLIAMIGEGKTRGQTAILDIESTINQNIAAVDIRHGLVESEYLWGWFQMHYLETRRQGSGSGPQALNCQRVRELPFALPPLEEQVEIVRRVEGLFVFADQIEQRVKEAQKHVDQLTQSILAKAFRGELTETWRAANPDLITGENSAETLLERIQEEQEKLGRKKNNRKRQAANG